MSDPDLIPTLDGEDVAVIAQAIGVPLPCSDRIAVAELLRRHRAAIAPLLEWAATSTVDVFDPSWHDEAR
jgi:hypothetical protein